jgi:hypothetical protein
MPHFDEWTSPGSTRHRVAALGRHGVWRFCRAEKRARAPVLGRGASCGVDEAANVGADAQILLPCDDAV